MFGDSSDLFNTNTPSIRAHAEHTKFHREYQTSVVTRFESCAKKVITVYIVQNFNNIIQSVLEF